MSRFSIVVFILSVYHLGWSTDTFGQSQDLRQNIYVGTGFSLMGFRYSDGAVVSNGAYINNDTLLIYSVRNSRAALQTTYDYALNNRFSVGIAYSNQGFSENNSAYYYESFDSVGVPQRDYTTKINRNNIAIRFLWHYVQNEHFDIYAGLRYGVTVTNYKYDFFNLNTDLKITESDWTSIQLALGWRYYITENIALSAEAALGKPHYLSVGANYRF
jgi:hypothetical protein